MMTFSEIKDMVEGIVYDLKGKGKREGTWVLDIYGSGHGGWRTEKIDTFSASSRTCPDEPVLLMMERF